MLLLTALALSATATTVAFAPHPLALHRHRSPSLQRRSAAPAEPEPPADPATWGGYSTPAETDTDTDTDTDTPRPRLFVFGLGYVGLAVARAACAAGWEVSGTTTSAASASAAAAFGCRPLLLRQASSSPEEDAASVQAAAGRASHVLATAPPEDGRDPALSAMAPALRAAARAGTLAWAAYLSSTGVYGDRGGAWVDERAALAPPRSLPRKPAARVLAERAWLSEHAVSGVPAAVFRLAGIYGPGRSALDTVRRAKGDLAAAGADDVGVVNRCHVADVVHVLSASAAAPVPGATYNVADDRPCTRYEVMAHASGLLGYPPMRPAPAGQSAVRFGSKRVANAKAAALLAGVAEGAGRRALEFPDYRAGLAAIRASEPEPELGPEASAAAGGGDMSMRQLVGKARRLADELEDVVDRMERARAAAVAAAAGQPE